MEDQQVLFMIGTKPIMATSLQEALSKFRGFNTLLTTNTQNASS